MIIAFYIPEELAESYRNERFQPTLAKLKNELKRKEGVEKRWFDRCMEARAENVKLKRALWLMTAQWAEAMGLASCNIANKFMSRENFEVCDDYRNNTVKKYRHRQVVFYKYADYCRKKAETK